MAKANDYRVQTAWVKKVQNRIRSQVLQTLVQSLTQNPWWHSHPESRHAVRSLCSRYGVDYDLLNQLLNEDEVNPVTTNP